MSDPATERGRETRERILLGAVRLFHERGVSATSLDEVLAAAGAGKGQFYRYFRSKDELVSAVVDQQLEQYLGWQREAMERLESREQLEEYLDDLVAAHRGRDLTGGCPVGSLALELAGSDERLRRRMAAALEGWEADLTVGLSRLADRGELSRELPPARLARYLLATIQGAYLLSTVRRDETVMSEALGAALDQAGPRPAPSPVPLSAPDGTE